MDKDLQLISYALWVCASSQEDSDTTNIIVEWAGDLIKVTTINKKTKEKREELVKV
jgi:hypothetical protein